MPSNEKIESLESDVNGAAKEGIFADEKSKSRH